MNMTTASGSVTGELNQVPAQIKQATAEMNEVLAEMTQVAAELKQTAAVEPAAASPPEVRAARISGRASIWTGILALIGILITSVTTLLTFFVVL